jgi:hypothetical protein
MDREIHAIIATDSRGKNFVSKAAPNSDIYQTHNLVCRGARIDRVSSAIFSCLRRINPSSLVLVRICAGINELTYKYHHKDGNELVPHIQQNVIQHLLQLKEKIRRKFPSALVGIATIPIVNLAQSKLHYMEKGWLSKPLYDESQTLQHQRELSITISNINARIVRENSLRQYIPEIGLVLPTQLFLNQDIEKVSIRKKGGKRRLRKHIQISSLPDGVHPSDRISDKWFNCIHENFKRELDRIKHPIPIQA